jgi:DNA-binding CsgD family transcriptional regulator
VAGRVRAARIVEGIEHLPVAGLDDRELRARIRDVIRGVVPFDAYAFMLTDPVTWVGCSPLAEVPDLSMLPDLIRLKYSTTVNRWTNLPDGGCRTLVQATAGRPERSLVWQECLRDLGVDDVLSAVFRDRYGCWAFLDLWRRGSVFTEDETVAVAQALPVATGRLRRVQADCFAVHDAPPAPRGPGALVLSPALDVRALTPQTQDWLGTLIPPEVGGDPVPSSAYNVAAQLLAKESRVDGHPAQARVHLGRGSWLTLRAARLGGPHPEAERDIVVTMETSSPGERRDVFARAHALTGREGEVLARLAEGGDTRMVATQMAITELTVQDHLKAIFTKTGTSSRRQLLTRALGR